MGFWTSRSTYLVKRPTLPSTKLAKMKTIFFGLLVICLISLVLAKKRDNNTENCKTMHKGCRVEQGKCVCGHERGCISPFVYRNEHQCLKDLRGEYDKCKKHPCEHGQCVQAKMNGSRRWECSCAGSGFYGKRCQHECPPADADVLPSDYPSDCVY